MRAFSSSVLTLLLVAALSASAMAEATNPQKMPRPNAGSRTTRRSLYRPPNASRASGDFTNSARRGRACSPKMDTSLTAIAPRTHVGQTLSDTPTFVWYVPDEDSFETRVELLAYDSSAAETSESTSLIQEKLQSQPGLMSWTVPESHRLEPGKLYWWRVIMFCNTNRPLDSVMVSADIKLGDTDDGLKALLSSTATDPLKQAEQLAQAGYWYDAMGLLVTQGGNAAAEHRQDMVQSLLDLNETVEPSDALSRYSQKLEKLLQVGL